MAGTGPAPKPDGARRRRNSPTHGPERVIVNDGALRGPALYEVCALVPEDDNVRAAVESWWETWRRAPQAALFLSTDWQRLGMLAPLVASYWLAPDKGILAEIRLNEERLGATLADRLKVRVRVEDSPGLASVSDLPSSRDRFADRGRK